MGVIEITDGTVEEARAAVLTVGAELVAGGVEEADVAEGNIQETTSLPRLPENVVLPQIGVHAALFGVPAHFGAELN